MIEIHDKNLSEVSIIELDLRKLKLNVIPIMKWILWTMQQQSVLPTKWWTAASNEFATEFGFQCCSSPHLYIEYNNSSVDRLHSTNQTALSSTKQTKQTALYNTKQAEHTALYSTNQTKLTALYSTKQTKRTVLYSTKQTQQKRD